jgi:cytosine/adenosine deaminase-related metal-dependent hydrolase
VPTLLKAATLIEFEPASAEVGDLRIAHGKIVARGPSLTPEPTDEVIDLSGRIIMPGLVSAYHHLHAIAARGLKPRGTGFAGARATLEAVEDQLTLDDLTAFAAVGGLEGLLAGTTTLFDVHAAPKATLGSSTAIAQGLNGVGLRAVVACEINDRTGALAREEALEENTTYVGRARGRFRGAFALRRLDLLSDDALTGLTESLASLTGPRPLLLMPVAEDSREEYASVERFTKTPVERLLARELVGPTSVLAQNVHLSWPELSQLISRGSWMVHTSRSNQSSQTGVAAPGKFGVRACVGTDVMSLDVLAEAQAATLRSLDAGQPIDILRFLANGQRLASEAFGLQVGPLREGAAADLIVSDYHPPTPLEASNLGTHVLYGMSSHNVESVMVDGLWRLWQRKPLAIDVLEVARVAREAASALWRRLPAPA